MTTANALTQSFRSGIQRALRSDLVASLTTPHGVDRYLETLNPAWAVHATRARVTAVRRQTDDTVTLTLRPNDNWAGFRPGQYVRLSIDIAGRRCTRCFSPANSAHAADGEIEITARVNDTGTLTRHLRDHARVGMVVTLSAAEGAFALPGSRPDRILLISGGSGITPVMAMLRTLCDEGHRGRITFLHYARSPAMQLYRDELAAIAAAHPNVELLLVYTDDDSGALQGRFDRRQLKRAVPDYRDATTFVCGPAGLMERVEAAWEAEGIGDRLHAERFTAAPMPRDDSAEGEVRFAHSERVATNDGGTLLDQAEAAGLRPEAGCRMGICHSCTCRKTSGRVRDTRSGAISDAGEEEIQICVSVPVGTVALDL